MNLYFSIRDEQMADNLLWYIKQYPNRKIIVWAQNVHVMTAYPGDITKEMWNEKPNAPPAPLLNWENTYMGWIVKDSIKNKVFSIAVTGNSGNMGRINQSDSTKTFRFPLNKSTRIGLLENYLDAAGFQYAFVNLKKPPLGGEWLNEKIIIRHTGGNGDAYYWHKAIDALYYVRNFSPVSIKD
jgi:erythromycin esterase-like protein